MKVTGRVSSFGGPDDTGVAPDEGLAFIYSVSDKPDLFLPRQPPGTTGLARRLDPDEYYIACRWDYNAPGQSKTELLEHVALVRAPGTGTGRQFLAWPADWGPHEDTGRVADISPGLMAALGIATDDEVEVIYPFDEEEKPVIHRAAISAGHGKHVPGASGYIDEAEETPMVMRAVAQALRARGITAVEFWDQTSTTQAANLDAIVDWHNAQTRDLDVSIHFNCGNGNQAAAIGTECLYVTQQELAESVAAAVATTGLIDRGAKYRGDLAFLNGTEMPAILVEVLFVNSRADVDIYNAQFDAICDAIAAGIAGTSVRPPRPPPPDAGKTVGVALTVPPGVRLELTVNGTPVPLAAGS